MTFSCQAAFLVVALAAGSAAAQSQDTSGQHPTPAEAMKFFALLDGIWRGPGTATTGDGSRLTFVLTERIGRLRGSSVRLLEWHAVIDGSLVVLQAVGVISYDGVYTMHAHAQGRTGDFPIRLTRDGYTWLLPLGDFGSVRIDATIENGELHETGDHLVSGLAPKRFFEIRLKRVGAADSASPSAVPE